MIRAIAFGAHPDDCEIRAGGTAALWTRMGHAVKFVSTTNGDAGHHELRGAALADRRRAEAIEAGRRLGGVEYEVLDHHDGELMPTLELRRDILRLIREWRADVVLGPRPNDYHPDHRNTGIAVQDAAYLVVVPSLVAAAALRSNPVFLYYEDRFQRPNPFRPDIAVAIDDVIDLKMAALDAHVSQFYEWLPWVEGAAGEVPHDAQERLEWLRRTRSAAPGPETMAALGRWYGRSVARYAEAFEICEYGAQPDRARVRELFPMLQV